jgi:hypothetical protein
MVGISGAAVERAVVVTASARNFPLRASLSVVTMLSNLNIVSPLSRAVVMGAAPLYGT